LGGQQYVLVRRDEFDKLQLKAEAGNLPPLPEPAPDGSCPAIEYARASLARDIILSRVEAGLTQTKLAKLAYLRLSTLQRIESGNSHRPWPASTRSTALSSGRRRATVASAN